MRRLLSILAAVLAVSALFAPSAFSLPDGRGWEMVSPVDKNGGGIQGFGSQFGGSVIQAAAQGGAITYSSSFSFANAQGSTGASQYVSTRGGSGWATDNVTLATESGAYGVRPDGVPYQLFTPDLSQALILIGHRCDTEPCPRSYAERDSGGTLSSLPYQETDLAFAGATPDLAHVVFSTCAALTPEAIEVPGGGGGCDPAKANLYERSGSGLKSINLKPGEALSTPGASLAAQSRAISSDGSRVYWQSGGNLYLREGVVTKQPDAAPGVGEGGTFETASTDGSVAYFSKEGHLWRYLAGSETATDLTPAGDLLGVLGASADGSYVYYLRGAGLFLWHSGTVTLVASQADADNYPAATGAARVSADGAHLAFLSTASLTGYDNRNATTNVPEPEVFLFTAPGTAGAGIVCASCNPLGRRPIGAASLPGASPNGTGDNAPHAYKPRVLSADSGRLFFDSDDALALQDTDNAEDVYQWEAPGSGSCVTPKGCIGLISSGRAEGGASFLDASTDGSDAFFLTDGSLVPSDPGGFDVYDARVGGGFPLPATPIPCFGDLCQPLPPEPEDPTPGTLRTKVSGNLPPPPAIKPHKCKKGQIKKLGKCVRKQKHHKKRGAGK
jgi:hypothetical protein